VAEQNYKDWMGLSENIIVLPREHREASTRAPQCVERDDTNRQGENTQHGPAPSMQRSDPDD